ncbi:hypothetical protein F5Y16DRAFT_265458 [Xylariaceae sp. FL0255]|nr:hypothetical protein F5Y16DRAFT_265458 [Xylariaceae sp. FL0255]
MDVKRGGSNNFFLLSYSVPLPLLLSTLLDGTDAYLRTLPLTWHCFALLHPTHVLAWFMPSSRKIECAFVFFTESGWADLDWCGTEKGGEI